MKRNYFDSKASVDESLEEVMKYINDWCDIFLEDAKRYRTNMKDLEGEKAYDDEEEMDDAAFADFDRKHVSGYDDFQSDYDYYRNDSKMSNPYDEDEDNDEDPKYFGEHFGAGFEIDEPRPEDYTDRKKFEDDLAAYDRFVEAGEECVRRGLEKPEWADGIKINHLSDDMDDKPYICKIYLLY